MHHPGWRSNEGMLECRPGGAAPEAYLLCYGLPNGALHGGLHWVLPPTLPGAEPAPPRHQHTGRLGATAGAAWTSLLPSAAVLKEASEESRALTQGEEEAG